MRSNFNRSNIGRSGLNESVKKSLPFFRTIPLAVMPWRYDRLKEKSAVGCFKYFFSFIFLAFVIAVVLMLPTIANFVDSQMSHFDTLAVSFDAKMNSAVMFPKNNPIVTVDTSLKNTTIKEGRVLITDDYIYKKSLLGRITQEPVGAYKNLLANENMVIFILLLMLPSLLFLFYLAYAVKTLFIVLLAVLVGFVVTRLVRFDVSFKETLKIALLSSTPMVIIDLVLLPFNLNIYFAQYAVFLLFFIIGIVRSGDIARGGEFGGSRNKRSYSSGGNYIDLTKR